MSIRNKLVVVFDLDDTLYKERDYRQSGIDAVLESIRLTYGEHFLAGLPVFNCVNSDWLTDLCGNLKLSDSIKESLLWTYRLHDPTISLSASVDDVLRAIGGRNQIVILTDGRSITQRKKLKALGLNSFPVYISEEHGDKKPSMQRFKLVMTDFPAEKYFYIGDNPLKDFLAPNKLGWTSVCIKDDGRNLHHQDVSGLKKEQLPQLWINSFEQLLEVVC